jgi:DNA-binding NarL/FixJ family response regulator
MPDTIRVLWVDDSPDLLGAYSRLVQRTPGLEMIGTLQSADELVSESTRLSPDVVVIDLTMPGKEPLSAVSELSGKMPNIRSIVFSGYDDDATVRSAVDAGAWGLVPKLKGGLPGDVLGTIRRVINGEMCFPTAH